MPEIVFGPGSVRQVAGLTASLGRSVLLVTGRRSFLESPHGPPVLDSLERAGLAVEHIRVEGEPSPAVVDGAVERFAGTGIDAVLGIGGGSVLDAAKAMAGLLPHGNPVLDHLEGVGRGVPYTGPALPFVAVPTTAGTGSEATKNAVLSVRGREGFKKSFRHDCLVPRYAVVDPDLLAGCPPELIASDGMDALTQLLESFVSVRANPFSDALAESGLAAARDALLPWYEGSGDAGASRAGMAYAAMISGITLAQAGLGSVHGLASPLGAFSTAPHGVVCGTLVAAATRINVRALRQRDPDGPGLVRYRRAAAILGGEDRLPGEKNPDTLVDLLEDWTRRLRLPRLGTYGVSEEDVAGLVAGCRGGSMKTNPIVLEDREIEELVRARL